MAAKKKAAAKKAPKKEPIKKEPKRIVRTREEYESMFGGPLIELRWNPKPNRDGWSQAIEAGQGQPQTGGMFLVWRRRYE